VTILVLENIFIVVHFSLSQAENSRNPPDRSWDLYLCPTNRNSRIGTTLPGHKKGEIEDDIRNPDRRGRHSETLTKEEKNIKERRGQNTEATRREVDISIGQTRYSFISTGRPKYGGHEKRG
jgi:hypothetical protein